eukprot:gene110-4359_t
MGQGSKFETKTLNYSKEFTGHQKSVVQSFFYKGNLYTGSKDSTIRQWEISSGICTNVYKGHKGHISALVVNKIGILYSGSSDSEIRAWSADRNQVIKILKGHEKSISCLLLTDDFLYSGSFDHQIRKWDVASGQTTLLFKGHTDTITCLKRQGDSLFSGSADNTVKVWNIYDGECMYTLKGHSSWVWDVVFNQDFIWTSSMDSTIKKWSKKDGSELSTFKDHSDCVCKLALSSGNSVISASWDNKLMEFDVESDKQLKVLSGHSGRVRYLIIRGRILISAADDNDIRIWDLQKGILETIMIYMLVVKMEVSENL